MRANDCFFKHQFVCVTYYACCFILQLDFNIHKSLLSLFLCCCCFKYTPPPVKSFNLIVDLSSRVNLTDDNVIACRVYVPLKLKLWSVLVLPRVV